MKFTLTIRWIASVAALFLIAGCASTPKPTVVKVSLYAQTSVNPDAHRRASPVEVKFYELKSVAAFNSADFFSIFDSEQKILGAELLNVEMFQLRPGERLEFHRPLHADTRHLAAVAAFRDLEHSQWRATLAMPPKEKISTILIQVDADRIRIGAEKECSFLCGIISKKPAPLGSGSEIIRPQNEIK
ncbi:MAG: type VI secretion system lipoprotein TssJ [Nitrosospira sp.]